MQKQRSPYTGGSFNLQQLKATTFSKDAAEGGLNVMPYLRQWSQKPQRPAVNQRMVSPSPQPMNVLGDSVTGGNERGLRSGTPRSYGTNDGHNYNNMSNYNQTNSGGSPSNNFNGSYEGEIPLNSLSSSYSNQGVSGNEDYMGDMLYNGQQMGQQMEQTDNMATSESFQNFIRNQADSESDDDFGFKTAPLPKKKPPSPKKKEETRWDQLREFLKAELKAQQAARKKETVVEFSRRDTIMIYVLLVLQLFTILYTNTKHTSARLGESVSQMSFRLWRCKFQLRSLMRQLLWRMSNAKGNDVLLFSGVLVLSPWIFAISLMGFLVSFTFLAKEGIDLAIDKVRKLYNIYKNKEA